MIHKTGNGRFWIFCFSMGCFLLPVVQCFAASAGGSSANFLKLGAGARYLPLSQAAVAQAEDVNALYWNPALLSRVKGSSLTLMHMSYAEFVNYQYFAYGQHMGRSGALAASAAPTGSTVGSPTVFTTRKPAWQSLLRRKKPPNSGLLM